MTMLHADRDSMPKPLPISEDREDAAMFELAPVSLWLEDYSEVQELFRAWRREGVTSLRDYLHANPAKVKECSDRIRVLRVNKRTLGLFEARDLDHLVANLGNVFRNDMFKTHIEELDQLWNGRTEFESQTVNYTLGGRRLDIHLTGSVVPGYEDSWERVL